MSITSFENTQNIQALQIFQDEMDVITSRTFPIANGYSTCPCGSVVKGIRKHLETGKHQVYEARLTNSITQYTQLIATYEQEQEEEEEPNCHICGQETDACSCNDEYINFKSYHGGNGQYPIEDLEDTLHQEYIELFIDTNHIDMTDEEAVEKLVLNDQDCEYLIDENEHLEFIDTDEVIDIRNEVIKHTTITPDICDIIGDYAANIDFDAFYHDMITENKINIIRHDIVSIDLCYFGHEKYLCLVFQSREYRDDHYVYNDGYLHTLNYVGEDEYGNAKYARQSNRGMPINNFNILDYGRGNFTIQYKDL